MKHIAAQINTPAGTQTPIAILTPVDNPEFPPFDEPLWLVEVDADAELEDVGDERVDVDVIVL
ncbi:hypothetical protein N7493_002996 [Penicillium malachiteum]|uniref:Uncharacterized protein n=1 Tax=Penicillium malachiteum TaxID=1324776 RepID=A0AAD6HT89_9EURO|nr:hypothetical protein N7493_002996 [Penicillium malachiteum]